MAQRTQRRQRSAKNPGWFGSGGGTGARASGLSVQEKKLVLGGGVGAVGVGAAVLNPTLWGTYMSVGIVGGATYLAVLGAKMWRDERAMNAARDRTARAQVPTPDTGPPSSSQAVPHPATSTALPAPLAASPQQNSVQQKQAGAKEARLAEAERERELEMEKQAALYIEARLREYVGEQKLLPTEAQFEKDGKRALWKSLQETGGAEHWAAKLGVERRTLGSVLTHLAAQRRSAGKSPWPSTAEWASSPKLGRLQQAMGERGEQYWAGQVLPPGENPFTAPAASEVSKPSAPRGRWNGDQEVEFALAEFCRSHFAAGNPLAPARVDFEAAGADGKALYAAVGHRGGLRAWLPRVGVTPRVSRA